MNTTTTTADLPAIGAKHRALRASGDHPAVAADLVPGLGAALVEAAGVTAGQRVLDIGAGTGNAAIPGRADRCGRPRPAVRDRRVRLRAVVRGRHVRAVP